MRIVGGRLSGRRFYPPANKWPTRPTTDFAKEGLYNILQNNFDFGAIRMLDLFGGTGSHSYECASRGCTDITYVDKFRPCVQFVRKTAEQLQVSDNIRIVQSDVFRFVKRPQVPYQYIFAGPPYALPTIDTIPDLVFKHGLVAADGWLVLEHNPNHQYEGHAHFLMARHYGKTIFSFFHMGE